MFHLNLFAAALLVAGFVPGGLVYLLTRHNEPAALLVCGAIFVGGDLALRVFRRHQPRWLVSGAAGGQVFVFPVWALGLVQLGVAVSRLLPMLRR